MRIVLTGFMGAGKTTIGPLVAGALGWRFVDADGVIEETQALSVGDIFEQRGEAAFRALEEEVILQLLQQPPQAVLALGGGALESEVTRVRLGAAPRTLVIFLHASLGVALSRCQAKPGAPRRPLLADPSRLRERYTARLPFYRSAHQTIHTDGLTPQEAASQIVAAVMNHRR